MCINYVNWYIKLRVKFTRVWGFKIEEKKKIMTKTEHFFFESSNRKRIPRMPEKMGFLAPKRNSLPVSIHNCY